MQPMTQLCTLHNSVYQKEKIVLCIGKALAEVLNVKKYPKHEIHAFDVLQ